MKRNKLLLTLLSLGILMIGYGIGYSMGYKSSSNEELINTQRFALEKAYRVIENNDLLDIDGSDDMSDYLELQCKVDSLYRLKY